MNSSESSALDGAAAREGQVTPRRAVISGASIAGLSAAFWLARTGWQVTVLEKADAFRDGGQNVDVRGVAHEVLDRMGLVAAVKDLNTTETGTVFVDSAGAVTAEMPSDGPDAATAELEVLRGDFARAILEALPDDVAILYGDTVGNVDDAPGAVTVTTTSGRVVTADLLVIAEGVRSATRNLVFDDVEQRRLGITMAFGTIARTADDDDRWRWYNAVGGRQVHVRPDSHGTTRAILAFTDDDSDPLATLDRPQVLSRLRARFTDAGWEAPRVLEGFATSDDLYVDDLTQIHAPTWHRGRVCLVGDAAWCVTPLGGGGASLALASGYILAAYLSTTPDTATALAEYERWMRPLVDDTQKLPPGMHHVAFPQSKLGVKVRDVVMKAVTSKPLATLAAKLTEVAQTEQPLPDIVVAD